MCAMPDHTTPRVCSPDTFRIVYRLCLRLTRKTPFAPYLCSVRTDSDDAEKQLTQMLHDGEVICRIKPELLYVLFFAFTDEEAAQTQERILCVLPEAFAHAQCLRAEVPCEPDPLA